MLHKLDAKMWILKAGSPVNPIPTNDTGHALGAKYDGQIGEGHTTVDLVFTSSSTAATYVAGSNRSGNATWRTSTAPSSAILPSITRASASGACRPRHRASTHRAPRTELCGHALHAVRSS